MRTIFLSFILIISATSLFAQPIYDECTTAIHLPNTDSWCSNPGAYTNVNATPYSGTLPPTSCFLQVQNEVWFTFRPQTPAIYFKISGNVNGLGTLRNPGIAIF